MKPVNSYQSGMVIPGENKPSTNGVYFATEKEAWEAGKELMSRWFVPSGHTEESLTKEEAEELFNNAQDVLFGPEEKND